MVAKRLLSLIFIIALTSSVAYANEEKLDEQSNSTSPKKGKVETPKVQTLDQKISVQSAKLQAITNLRKQLVQSRKPAIDTLSDANKKEMDFVGKLRRVGTTYPESSPNLIDLVVEKKVT